MADTQGRLSGSILGERYKLGALLAATPSFETYEASRTAGGIAAVKVLAPPHDVEPSHQQMVADAVRAMRSLESLHTVRVFDGEGGTLAYYAMPLLRGRTLRTALQDGPLTVKAVLHIGAQLARALEEAHSKQVFHGRLHAGNVFLLRSDEGESVRLADFQLDDVRAEEQIIDRDRQLSSMMRNCPQGLSPQVLFGNRPDASADLYALGALLFLAASGRPHFEGDRMTVLDRIRSTPAPRLQTVLSVPDAFDTLVARLLAKQPKERPSAEETAKILEGLDAA